MSAPTPPSRTIAMPPEDGGYSQGYVLIGGVQTAASLPIYGMDGPTFRQFGDAWAQHIAAASARR